MATVRARHLFVLLLAFLVEGRELKISNKSLHLKALREMSNQTQADSLNLPANASSIRENITDTFSCENRTYGYYADVDNDCQVFHVCLPSQTPSGRNVTYRWSFICPNETIFNQEALTCTRPQDSIECEDSPMYYHLNMEIGKTNKTEEEEPDKKDEKRIQKRKLENRKANLVMESFIKESQGAVDKGVEFSKNKQSPMLLDAVIENVESEADVLPEEDEKDDELDRIVMEKKERRARKLNRGSLRFKNDV